jgi:hypothetical protein
MARVCNPKAQSLTCVSHLDSVSITREVIIMKKSNFELDREAFFAAVRKAISAIDAINLEDITSELFEAGFTPPKESKSAIKTNGQILLIIKDEL